MQPADLDRLTLPGLPSLSLDGSSIAFTVTGPRIGEDRSERRIWVWRDGVARPFTAGPADVFPMWSPDGRQLAFLRASSGRGQVAVISADGGDARVISDFPVTAESFAWAPDGDRLAVIVLARRGDETIDDAERARRPKRITELPLRRDQEGFVHARRRQLVILTVDESAPPQPINCGGFDVTRVAWDPGGRQVAVVREHPGRTGLGAATDVAVVDLDSGGVTSVVGRGQWTTLSYRPDGVLHVVGHPDPDEHVDLARLWRVEPDGLRCLTENLDLSVNPFDVVSVGGPQWHGDDALCAVERRGRIEVIRVAPDGATDTVVTGDRVVAGFSTDAAGTIAFVASTATDPGELYRLDSSGEECLTQLNVAFRKETPLREASYFVVDTSAGEVDTWVYLPPGDDLVPALLVIHGGPANQYGYGFLDEFQAYAGAGYGIVACNPRGSSGRGRDHLRAVMNDGWGTVDVEDVTAALDAALARFPRLDSRRQGVMGGSYGGFLTSWLTSHSDRFRSAVVERALTAWDSFTATSDVGWLARAYLGADGPADQDRLRAASPVTYAHLVRTPTLVIHAEDDFRAPMEQAERLFAAMLQAGVETEFLRFPSGGHELSRSGRPRHRIERFEAILDWHHRHLTL